jgi:hypothetical protein
VIGFISEIRVVFVDGAARRPEAYMHADPRDHDDAAN